MPRLSISEMNRQIHERGFLTPEERRHTSAADYYAESRCGECGAVMLVKPRGRRRRCRACEEENE